MERLLKDLCTEPFADRDELLAGLLDVGINTVGKLLHYRLDQLQKTPPCLTTAEKLLDEVKAKRSAIDKACTRTGHAFKSTLITINPGLTIATGFAARGRMKENLAEEISHVCIASVVPCGCEYGRN